MMDHEYRGITLMVSRPHEVSPIFMASWLPAVTSLQATPLTAPCGRPGKVGPVMPRGESPSCKTMEASPEKTPGKSTYWKDNLKTARCLLCHSLSLSLAETIFDGSPQFQRQANLWENHEVGESLATHWHVIWHLNQGPILIACKTVPTSRIAC